MTRRNNISNLDAKDIATLKSICNRYGCDPVIRAAIDLTEQGPDPILESLVSMASKKNDSGRSFLIYGETTSRNRFPKRWKPRELAQAINGEGNVTVTPRNVIDKVMAASLEHYGINCIDKTNNNGRGVSFEMMND